MPNPVKIAVGTLKIVGGVCASAAGLAGIDVLADKAKDLLVEGGKDLVDGATEG